jgi:ABC-type sugar transport system substrate-binding protein
MRFIICAMTLLAAFLAALTSSAAAASRAYVMNGLFVGHGLAVVADALRQRGYIVAYGSFEQSREFAADACAHVQDRIVVIGHSFGAERAAEVATHAAACGARDVTLIGIDPSEPVAVTGVSHAVNFVGELGGTIAGAENIPVPGYTHMGILDSPAMQQRILQEADQGGGQ